ncbi:unnamed protein product [Mytilus coruscus]|uniref:Chitin-binding type-2 domain-containing protein n=1 Tax=Mytilus coruscus TaxID=42192 RepID=A0A6J8ETZ1_MYTCO|nr:unnamed protein product [Mytilus coruscus]
MNPVLSLIIIIININTICGIPDFNLFPFEIDEDLLFALGYHRWHRNNHGLNNNWFQRNTFPKHNVATILTPRPALKGWLLQQIAKSKIQNSRTSSASTSTLPHVVSTPSLLKLLSTQMQQEVAKINTYSNDDDSQKKLNNKNSGLSDEKSKNNLNAEIIDFPVNRFDPIQQTNSPQKALEEQDSNPSIDKSDTFTPHITTRSHVSTSSETVSSETTVSESSTSHTSAESNWGQNRYEIETVQGNIDVVIPTTTAVPNTITVVKMSPGSSLISLQKDVRKTLSNGKTPESGGLAVFDKEENKDTSVQYLPPIKQAEEVFRNDLKKIFKHVTTTPGTSMLDPQYTITKEYKPATVEFRPLSEIYKIVTPTYRDIIGRNSSKKTISVRARQNGEILLNVQNDSPFSKQSIDRTREESRIFHKPSVIATTQWPFLNGLTVNSFDSTIKSPVASHEPLVAAPSKSTPNKRSSAVGVPVQLPVISSDMVQDNYLTNLAMSDRKITPLETIAAQGACTGCKMENGAGYNSHPTDCDKYTQCLFDKEGLLAAFYRNCPWGQYWNQDILSCQQPKHVMCKNDPCLNVRFETYAAKSSCRAYWECQGYSVPMCCPQGHAYLSNVGCVQDYSCQDECQSDNVPKYSGCDKRIHSRDPAMFEQMVPGHGWVKMHCAAGTQFNPAECSCSLTMSSKNLPQECKSLMFLEFTKHISDSSGNDVFVKNENVKVRDGVAYFNGSARLVIPQFTNAELGNNFGFRIRFKESKIFPGHGLRQSIINNGDCGDLGSVRLTINDNNVEFGLETDGEEGPMELRIKKPSVEWTEVVYYVTDNKLNGWVNGEAGSVTASGQIEKRKCALQLGHGEGFSNFIGFIDEVEFFRCDSGDWERYSSVKPSMQTLPIFSPTKSIPKYTTKSPITSTKRSTEKSTMSNNGIFVTMPTEQTTIPQTTRYWNSQTLPPIDFQTLPTITVPPTTKPSTVWLPAITTPKSKETTTAQYKDATTASVRSTTPSSWVWRTMPPIVPVTWQYPVASTISTTPYVSTTATHTIPSTTVGETTSATTTLSTPSTTTTTHATPSTLNSVTTSDTTSSQPVTTSTVSTTTTQTTPSTSTSETTLVTTPYPSSTMSHDSITITQTVPSTTTSETTTATTPSTTSNVDTTTTSTTLSTTTTSETTTTPISTPSTTSYVHTTTTFTTPSTTTSESTSATTESTTQSTSHSSTANIHTTPSSTTTETTSTPIKSTTLLTSTVEPTTLPTTTLITSTVEPTTSPTTTLITSTVKPTTSPTTTIITSTVEPTTSPTTTLITSTVEPTTSPTTALIKTTLTLPTRGAPPDPA